MRRAIVSLLVAALASFGAVAPARADLGNASGSWAITATGVTPWLPLYGQNNCIISVTGSPVGLVAVPQVATDPGPNYQSIQTASSISSGSITGTGAFNGSVATQQPSAIRVNVTGYTSGATQLSIVCGPGGGTGGGGGGSGPVTQSTGNSSTPWYMRVCDPITVGQCQAVTTEGAAVVGQIGRASHTTLTSASATACTSLQTGTTGTLVAIVNANASAQAVTLTLFDEGASPTCVSADQIYQVQLGAGQLIILNLPLGAGLAYTLSSAAANNIIIYRAS